MKAPILPAVIAPLMLLSALQSAQALSCMAPDPLLQYTQARDSKDLYSMVIGQILPKGPIIAPKQDLDSNRTDTATTTARVRLTGRALANDGFTFPYDQEVTLRLTCLSIWCADPPPTGQEIFLTLRHDGDMRIADIGPCPANALPWSADSEARVLNCHRFQQCDLHR